VASESPDRPKTAKGALLVYTSTTPGAQPSQRIDFHYNPEQLRRSFAARAPQQQPQAQARERASILTVAGPPVETITLSIVLDAADQLAEPDRNRTVAENGLHPALATLELLLYPSTARMSEIDRQAAAGEVQVAAGEVPLVVLAWGQSRVVPVQIASFNVTEEQFDEKLNPIFARVELGLRVLTYMEFTRDSAGRETYIAYQKKKEQLAGMTAGATP
jgi:hypothetical protein